MKRTLVLFPGALGDFLCLCPALRALRRAAGQPLTLVVRNEWSTLLPRDEAISHSIDRREVSELFGTAPLSEPARHLLADHDETHSFTGHGDPNFNARLAEATGGRVFVHPFRGMQNGEHATAYFARCLDVTPEPVAFEADADAVRWAREFWQRSALGPRTLAIHPGSGSPSKNWQGMSALAQTWQSLPGQHVLAILGPAEAGAPDFPSCDAIASGQSLMRIAALLGLAYRYVGNDSGVSHLAGFVGSPAVVLFASTCPRSWRPNGGNLRVLTAPFACPSCGPHRFCIHRLPVEAVRDALLRPSLHAGTCEGNLDAAPIRHD